MMEHPHDPKKTGAGIIIHKCNADDDSDYAIIGFTGHGKCEVTHMCKYSAVCITHCV